MADPTGRAFPSTSSSTRPKIAGNGAGQVANVRRISDDSLRPIAPQPTTIVYQTENSRTIYVDGRYVTVPRTHSGFTVKRFSPLRRPGASDAMPFKKIALRKDVCHRETETVEKNLDDAIVKMYVNKGCRVGPLLDSEKVAQLHDYHPLPYPAQITRIVQDLIYCAQEPKRVFDLIRNVGPDVPGMKITVLYGSEALTKHIPIHLSSVSAIAWLQEFLAMIDCCRFLVARVAFFTSCDSCGGERKPDLHSVAPAERTTKYKREYDMLKQMGARLRSCDEVALEFRKRLGNDVAQIILDNNIDSSVLPFCQADLLREQMNIPRSTTLKMAAVALELRAAAFESLPPSNQLDPKQK